MDSCAAPDSKTRVPRFKMPALACDAHCHVFGPAAKFPYAPNRAYTPPDAPKERLEILHKTLGIERAVIVQASCHGTDNRAMLDAIATSGGRYRGIAIVDETFTDRDYAALQEGGIRGVRFNFVKHLGGRPDMNVFRHVLERIQPLGWHLVVHLDAADIAELSGIFRTLSVPFIIDHMGRVKADAGLEQEPFRALLDLLKLENCWVKVCGAERVSTTGPPFADAIPFAAGVGQRRSRSRTLGHRLASSKRWPVHAERRRSGRSPAADRAERGTQGKTPGQESSGPIRFWALMRSM